MSFRITSPLCQQKSSHTHGKIYPRAALCGVDVNKPDSYDQTALDIVTKFTSGHAGKELKHILKEASCAVYARATKDYSNVYDPGSLAFKEGDIITVLEQKADGIWRGYVFHEGRMAKTGMFPANHVVLVDSKALARQQQQQQHQQHLQKLNSKPGHMFGPVPDLLSRGPPVFGTVSTTVTIHSHSGGSDRGSLESSSTEDSQPNTSHSFPSTPSTGYPPPPPASLISSYPPRSPLTRDTSCADSGFSSSQSLPQNTPSSPAAPQQFGKSPFAFGPTVIAPNGSNQHFYASNGNGPIQEYHHQQQHPPYHIQHHPQHGEWPAAPTALPAHGGVGADMRGASPAKDSPGHSNRNSAASSDSGRGYSTGHTDAKFLQPTHNFINIHVNNQQHRLSGQSYESGVSSRQSYHSTSSSSLGSLDRLEEPGYTSTINVLQLFQAGVPDNEVLHAWLHELGFVEYYPLFYQAGYDMPTISRMTPEDLTAIGITKPAHRKRLKSEIARLNIHDGIPDYKPNDLMEWLHLLGLGTYLDTLCGQGYDNIDYVTDITWEDLEEIGIQKLGHQKKIMLAIDRLKRITSGGKRLSSVDGRTASLELLEPPPPAPPITGRWSGSEMTAIPQHVYETTMGGARPKKSPSGDSISTISSGNSGSSVGSGGAAGQGEMRVIPLPREDAGLAGATPYRHNSTGSAGSLQPDIVAIQVKRNTRSSTSEDKRDSNGQPLMYHSFQGSTRRSSENDVFLDNTGKVLDENDFATYQVALDKRNPVPKAMVKSESEKHESEINTDGNKSLYYSATHVKPGPNNNNNMARVDAREHIYDTPQIVPPHISQTAMNVSLTGSLHINTENDSTFSGQPKSLSPGGKGAKKIPPPPPKRTHSIREETNLLSQSAPASPSRNLNAPTTITVSASVHPQPTTIVAALKQPPPPVMQKPQKPHSPSVANKFQQQIQTHPQQPMLPPQQQQQQQPQHYQQQTQSTLNAPAVAQKPLSPKPGTAPKLIVAATPISPQPAPSSQQPPVFAKPKVIIQPQVQQQAQPKSPVPPKSPMAMANMPKPQQQLPYIAQVHPSQQHPPSQPSSPHPATNIPAAHTGQPQVQAFASCVKSLSEKFGKKTEEEDQFPDNVSTDSDDFPPPPPPIAMDIITPKIHNYGIPSLRGKGEYGMHQRDYGNKPRPNQPGPRNFIPPGSSAMNHPRLAGNVMPVLPTPKPSPNTHPGPIGGVQLRKHPNALSVTSGSPAGSEHESTPEHDTMHAICHDKRSESTTSFESNSSSSSIDSNTLPFANENVGTIKQRAANAKPSIVQTVDMDGGHRNVDLNPNVFDNESLKYSNSSSQYKSHTQHMTINEQSRSSGYNGSMPPTHVQNKVNKPPNPSGAIRAPVPNPKPMLSPKPSRPISEPSDVLPPLPAESQKPVSSGNVLSDIDDMLQGLTDELDAMLEQEMNS
ncbi:caskin-2-like isoform X4 [Biomphalaria glabrata]|uniref:Caskin-2-like isoform X4 n=1 Tax=Biomphalaria glabrata TaxID=6526 RepID=A0A9W2ZIJ9_BIOGL|nr:caskin-2-like isoform X4 [Biomphalaria glabrata]